MASFRLSKADQGRLESLKEAFHRAVEVERKKGMRERLHEAISLPISFHKGAAKGTLKMLESGEAPLVHSLMEGYQLFKNPERYWDQKCNEQRLFQSTLKGFFSHPFQSLRSLTEGFKEQVTQKAISFLKATPNERAESEGKIAPDLALALIGGEALEAESWIGQFSRGEFGPKHPLGFRNLQEFKKFSSMVVEGLEGVGASDAKVFLRGSSVTGTSFRTGLPFDVGRVSDFDIAISSPSLFEKAENIGLRLRSKGTRTPPLQRVHKDQLSLTHLEEKLQNHFGHPVSFMIYQSPEGVFLRGPNRPLP